VQRTLLASGSSSALYVLFTLKPNDGVSTRGLVNSSPPMASSILELVPCSMPVTSHALGGALQHCLGQGTEIWYSEARFTWGDWGGGCQCTPFGGVVAVSCVRGSPPSGPREAATEGDGRDLVPKWALLRDTGREKSSAAAGRGARAKPSSSSHHPSPRLPRTEPAPLRRDRARARGTPTLRCVTGAG